MSTILKRSVKEFIPNLVIEELLTIYNERLIPIIKEIILSEYEQRLNEVIFLKYGFEDSAAYKINFFNKLDEFEFIKDIGYDGFIFVCPDMDNFDFSGELEDLKKVLDGDYLIHRPIDIFEEAERYFDEEYDVRDEAIDRATERFENFSKGLS